MNNFRITGNSQQHLLPLSLDFVFSHGCLAHFLPAHWRVTASKGRNASRVASSEHCERSGLPQYGFISFNRQQRWADTHVPKSVFFGSLGHSGCHYWVRRLTQLVLRRVRVVITEYHQGCHGWSSVMNSWVSSVYILVMNNMECQDNIGDGSNVEWEQEYIYERIVILTAHSKLSKKCLITCYITKI